jgi:cell division protein FtsB
MMQEATLSIKKQDTIDEKVNRLIENLTAENEKLRKENKILKRFASELLSTDTYF